MDSIKAGSTKDTSRGDEKRNLTQKISDFLRRSRGAILVVGSILLAAVIAVALWTGIKGGADRASSLRLSQLNDDSGAWRAQEDAAKKADLEKKLIAGLDDVIAKWPNLIAAQQALGLRATVAESKKDWASSEKDWLEASKRLPESFLAPISLQNAAVAAEELGALDRAKEHYKNLIDRYTGSSPGIPHAWFSLGRLAEEAKDYVSALASYEKVVATWPDSDWTKLSKDRIISIKSRGLVK